MQWCVCVCVCVWEIKHSAFAFLEDTHFCWVRTSKTNDSAQERVRLCDKCLFLFSAAVAENWFRFSVDRLFIMLRYDEGVANGTLGNRREQQQEGEKNILKFVM